MALNLTPSQVYQQNLVVLASIIEAGGDVLSALAGGEELSNQLKGAVLERNDLQELLAVSLNRQLPTSA